VFPHARETVTQHLPGCFGRRFRFSGNGCGLKRSMQRPLSCRTTTQKGIVDVDLAVVLDEA
jgi:hypothetical protein